MIFAIALAATHAPPIQPMMLSSSDALACTELTQAAQTTVAQLPKWVDAITRVDALVVTCPSRTYHVDKFINEPILDMRDGWQERKQAQWDKQICLGNLGPLVEGGWLISQVLTFAGGERIRMDARCRGAYPIQSSRQ